MRNNDIISVLAQRNEVGEKFISEAQSLIRSGKNVGAVLRKLQAARNALRGWVEEPEQASSEIAAAPVTSDFVPITEAQARTYLLGMAQRAAALFGHELVPTPPPIDVPSLASQIAADMAAGTATFGTPEFMIGKTEPNGRG